MDIHVYHLLLQWSRYTYEDLNGLDTMIKRLLRKGSEQIVRQFEYYRAAIEQEINSRGTMRQRRPINQIRRGSSSDRHSHFQYPPPPGLPSTSHFLHSHTLTAAQNHRHPTYQYPSPQHGGWGPNGCINPQLAVYQSFSSSEHSSSSTRTLKPHYSDLDLLQGTEETFV